MSEFKYKKIGIMQLFQTSAVIYKKHFKFILLIGLCVFIPYHIAVSLVQTPEFSPQLLDQIIAGNSPDELIQAMMLLALMSILFSPLHIAAVTYLSAQHVENREATVAGILDSSLMKWGKHIYTAFLYMAIVGIGSFLIVPAILFGISLTFYTNIVAMTDHWGVRALRHSFDLVKGRWFITCGAMLLIGILYWFSSMMLSILFTLLAYGMGEGAIQVVQFISGPIIDTVCIYFQIFIALWFINEGYLKKSDSTKGE